MEARQVIYKANRAATIQRFKDDIPRTLQQMLDGGTISSGCGDLNMTTQGKAIVLSRPVVEWLIAELDELEDRRRVE